MADKKISQLTASTTPLAGTEVLPVVQGGVTKQVSVANLTAGRAISATEATLTTGNLVIGTSGKGIDFSATANSGGTMTSELLADYEEGTWTATLKGGTSDPTTPVTVTGHYTKIGRIVQVQCQFFAVDTTGASGYVYLSGLPFNSLANNPGRSAGNAQLYNLNFNTGTSVTSYINGTTVLFEASKTSAAWQDVTHTGNSSVYLFFSCTYTTSS